MFEENIYEAALDEEQDTVDEEQDAVDAVDEEQDAFGERIYYLHIFGECTSTFLKDWHNAW